MASYPQFPQGFAPTAAPVRTGKPPAPPAWTPPTGVIPPVAPANVPPIVNYPTPAQQTALNAKGLSGTWSNWFSSVFGPLDQYYTPARGGEAQALTDYRQWQAVWQDVAGRPATDLDVANVTGQYRQWLLANRKVASLADFYDFTRQLVGQQKVPTPTVYSRIGNI